MEHMELVEKLREKTGVTYENARDALERTDWDMLESVVLLEKEGKMETNKEEAKVEKDTAQQDTNAQKASEVMENVSDAIGTLVDKGNRKHLEVYKDGQTVLSIPMTVLVLLVLLLFWVTIPAAAIAWLAGYRFRLVDKPAAEDTNKAQA